MKMMKRMIPVLFLALAPALQANEFSGFKMEYMNAENTNFYGFGVFTSNKRFDAEAEFFASSKAFDSSSTATKEADSYKYFYASFAGYFHFIRTDSISYYVGAGIFPFLPRSYAYHFTLGLDFFWSENFRMFYNYRALFNNASGHRYPDGGTFAAGFKYTWDLF